MGLRNNTVVVYGSYGYTGSLIVEECKRKNLTVILSGRNYHALEAQSKASGYPFECVELTNTAALLSLLGKGSIVIHCAGPFQFTAQKMAEACLNTRTHYMDISGEYQVFEMLATLDSPARQKQIQIMGGTGFDVVPSDCLAMYLQKQLPSATHLQLAFSSSGGMSRGTLKTMVENLGSGSAIRKNGVVTYTKTGEKTVTIDFGKFTAPAFCISWGDIATAYRSTGIKNIEVYTAVQKKTLRLLKLSNLINPLLRSRAIKNYFKSQIDKRPPGPSQEKLQSSRSYLWGKVWNEHEYREARLETWGGYALTAKSSVLIAEKILAGNFSAGYQTPAQAYGENLILEVGGSSFT